jgi:lysozyme
MQYSKEGIDLTKSFESCRLTAYRDIKGILTIGYGHTGPEVVEGLVWTQAQADSQLVVDLQWAENFVNNNVSIQLTQGEFDALVDFAFNLGVNAEKGSTLLKLVNEGDFNAAANEFAKWDHASGQVVAGLLRRRLAEKEEFTDDTQE